MSNTKIDPDFSSLNSVLPKELVEKIKQEYNVSTRTLGIKRQDKSDPKVEKNIKFDFALANTNKDIKILIDKLKKSKTKQYSLLLYGISGSGKTYFGRYLAQELKMPIIKKKASDLIDKWAGQTEQNIKSAFKEAIDKNAILMFDEADSFLRDRSKAHNGWEVSNVNEMLTQMESHPLPFICTTNLKESIDNASMRRFIFKIKYDYMTEKNVIAGVKNYFNLSINSKDIKTKELQYLCPGDLVTAKKKLDILEDGKYTKKLVLDYLRDEQDEKEIKISRKVGFSE